jgi:hypothetical protein
LTSQKGAVGVGFAEFVVLVTMLMSLTALSIDSMLTALPLIVGMGVAALLSFLVVRWADSRSSA